VPAYVVNGVLRMVSGSTWFGEARLGSGQGLGMGGQQWEGSNSCTGRQRGGYIWWCRCYVHVLGLVFVGLLVVLEGAQLERVSFGVYGAQVAAKP